MTDHRITVGLKEAIDMMMDPDSEFDVIIKDAEGIILTRNDPPNTASRFETQKMADTLDPTVWDKIVTMLK